MSATSGAVKGQNILATQAGLSTANAVKLSGADLAREALRVKGGFTAAQIAAMDGARLMQAAGSIDLGTIVP